MGNNLKRVGRTVGTLVRWGCYLFSGMMTWALLGYLWKPLMLIVLGLAAITLFAWLAWDNTDD
uniref:Uncharacterized protein n=1 Tax=viral metagenome TaxID=1070528 RepID=A0A6H1ZJV7_9ZZZZ